MKDLRWIGSNVALVLLCAGLIALEWFSVNARQNESIGKENRFLTTEWYLLQQLRKQTDAELAEKNSEIDRLKRLFADLKAHNDSPATLAQVESQLKAAESARGTILIDSVKSGLRVSLPAVQPDADPGPGADLLLSQRAHDLEVRANAMQARAETAEAALTELRRQLAKPEAPYSPVLDALERSQAAVVPPPPPTVIELKTKALTRAILNSPDIRRQYPRLLEDFDQYLEAYGAREYGRGRLTGLADSAQTVRAMNR